MWQLNNATSAGTLVGNVLVPGPIAHTKGYTGDKDGKSYHSSRAPVFVPDNTETVPLTKEHVERIKWVAQACDQEWGRERLRFVLADGEHVAGTNGHLLLFAPVPSGLAARRRLFSPAGLKPGLTEIRECEEGDWRFPQWQQVVARHWTNIFDLQAGVLAPFAKSHRILFQYGNQWHMADSRFYDWALNGVHPEEWVRLAFNLPVQPMGIMMPDRAGLVMPMRPQASVAIPDGVPTTTGQCAASNSVTALTVAVVDDKDYIDGAPPIARVLTLTVNQAWRTDQEMYWL